MLALGILLAGLSSAAPAEPKPPNVYAGLYLADVSGFDLREGRFHADFDVWLKWSGSPQPPTLRFVNGEIDKLDEQERESDGDWHSVRWRVQGTFRGMFPLHAFPFDRQQLKIELALPGDWAHLSPDLASSGMAERFSITGWEYEPFFRTQQGKAAIPSDLGSIKREGRSRVLESVAFVVDLRRPATSSVLKFMLPLAIILAMAFLVFVVPSDRLDVRASMGVTALLSVVAFHFAMAGSLPDVPYMVAADRLFLGSYILVLLSVFETVLVSRWHETRPPLVQRLDRTSLVVLSALAIGVATSVGLFRDRPHAQSPMKGAPAIPSAPAPEVASSEPELRVGVPNLASLSGQGFNSLLRRGLTHLGPQGELQPHLSEAVPTMTDESVKLLPDGGMLVRWRLRAGLSWSDGHPLRASDLIYSLSLISDPDRTEVSVLDDRTIEIRYRRRLASALIDFPLYPEHAAKQISADGGIEALRQHASTVALPGDGPYRLVAFTAGKEAVFERNPHFAGAPSRFDRIRYLVRDPAAMAEDLKTGGVHLVPSLPNIALEVARTQPEIALHPAADETLLFLHPDLSHPALADLRVRSALLKVLDRAAIASVYAQGAGHIAHTFRSEIAPDFASGVPTHSYAPEVGRKALQGLPPLKLFTAETPPGSGYAQAADQIVKSLSAAGLKIEREMITARQATEAFQRGKHGGLLLHTRSDKRPSRFFNLPMAGAVIDTRTPRPHFPPELVEANMLLESSLFPERSRLLSIRLQRAFAEHLPLLPLAFGAQVAARSKALEGFAPLPTGSVWWNVETWRVTKLAR